MPSLRKNPPGLVSQTLAGKQDMPVLCYVLIEVGANGIQSRVTSWSMYLTLPVKD